MTYFIISEMTYAGGELVHTPLAYGEAPSNTVDTSIQSAVKFNQWISENIDGLNSGDITPEAYLETYKPVYTIGWLTTNKDGLGLPNINDLDLGIIITDEEIKK